MAIRCRRGGRTSTAWPTLPPTRHTRKLRVCTSWIRPSCLCRARMELWSSWRMRRRTWHGAKVCFVPRPFRSRVCSAAAQRSPSHRSRRWRSRRMCLVQIRHWRFAYVVIASCACGTWPQRHSCARSTCRDPPRRCGTARHSHISSSFTRTTVHTHSMRLCTSRHMAPASQRTA